MQPEKRLVTACQPPDGPLTKAHMLTYSQAQALFAYDPATGVVTARIHRGRQSPKVGEPVGSLNRDGYLTVMVARRNYMLHVVAWLLVHGCYPANDLDHRDGHRANNRLSNLRPATRSENNQNMARRSDNTSGEPGVWQVRGRWRVRVTSHGTNHHVGYFDTLAEAKAARLAAKAKLHYFQPVPRADS